MHTYNIYIKLEAIYSSLGKSNIKDNYSDAATKQCLALIAEINVSSVSDKMLEHIGTIQYT